VKIRCSHVPKEQEPEAMLMEVSMRDGTTGGEFPRQCEGPCPKNPRLTEHIDASSSPLGLSA